MVKDIIGSGGCFPSSAQVLTESGYRNISKIALGDKVVSYDSTGRLALSIVENIFVHEPKEVHIYEYWGSSICATPNHWVLNQLNSFSEIGKLSTHDCLVDIDNTLRPMISSKFYSVETVYNLSVTPDHTFIVDGIRVHNGGGGKGGGSARAAVEDANTLRSRQYARVLDLISEGEIGGLVNGHQSIYFNEVPLQNTDGSYNFKGSYIATRNGTQNQELIPDLNSVEDSISVSTKVAAAIPLVRVVSNLDADEVLVTLEVPQLSYQDSTTGDLHGSSVSFTVEIQSSDLGASYVPQVMDYTKVIDNTEGGTTGIIIKAAGVLSNNSTNGNASTAVPVVSTSIYTTGALGGAKAPSAALIASTIISNTKATVATDLRVAWVTDGSGLLRNVNVLVSKRIVGTPTWIAHSVVSFSGTDIITVNTPSPFFNWGTTTTKTKRYFIKTIQVSNELNIYEFKVGLTGATPYGTVGILPSTSYTGQTIGTITGKTLARYQKGFSFNLVGTGPWSIKVTRTTADSTTANISNDLWWANYVEVIRAKLSYPNSALVYTAIDAEQFSSIPSRSYEIYGILCKVPSNYNPLTRVYTGFWDGTFVTAWTDNPAWVFYDLVSNTRYGLGDIVPGTIIDKWTLYSIAQYCDATDTEVDLITGGPKGVPDGEGGFEPRFTCNLYLQTREDAYKVISNMASIFRGMVFWATGLVTASQDAPRNTDAIYTAANVIDGDFSYTGTSAKTRHNVALVSWNNPANGYSLETEYVEDAEAIALSGTVLQTELSAMGCTSQGQAHRLGKWLIYTEQNETETVSFKTGLTGLIAQPGDIIKIQDPFRSGTRLGGRIISTNQVVGIRTEVVIDSPILFEPGKVYTILVTTPSNDVYTANILNTLDNTAQNTLVIPYITYSTLVPQIGSIWVVAVSTSGSESLSSWRVLSCAEASKGLVEITALKYNASKYAYVEDNMILNIKKVIQPSLVPAGVSEVVFKEHMYILAPGTLSNILSISWTPLDNTIDTYIVSYRSLTTSGNFKEFTVNLPSIEVSPVLEGDYEILITAKNALGTRSQTLSSLYTVVGKTVNPQDITTFTSTLSNDLITLSWSPIADLDLNYYEVRYGIAWGIDNTTSTYIYRGTIPSVILPKIYASGLAHKFWIKAIDTSGNWSASYTLSGTLIDNTSARILLTQSPAPLVLPVLVSDSLATTTMSITIPNNVTAISTALDTNVLSISWTNATIPTNGLSFQKYIVYINGVKFTETTSNKIEYTWLDNGLYKVIKVTTVDILGYESIGTTTTKTVELPIEVTSLTSTLVGTKVNLTWTAPIVSTNNVATKGYRIYVNSVVAAEVSTLNYSYSWADSSMSKVFEVETIDYLNNISTIKPSTTMNILVPNAPTFVVSIILGTNLSTTWTHSAITSNRFPIAKYNIYFGDIGNIVKFDEVVANSYIQDWTYGSTTKSIQVEAVDVLGHISSRETYSTTVVAPAAPSSLIATLKATKAMFTWLPAIVVANSLPIEYYELREDGSDWASSTFVANIPASSAALQYLYGIINTTELATVPVGTMQYDVPKVFRIASKDISGTYSSTHSSFPLTITKPTARTDISLNIVGPYINAAWSPIIQGIGGDAFTLPIDRYEIRATRNSVANEGAWSAATSLASLSGSAIALDPPTNASEDPTNNATGTWYYLIRAYDIFNISGTLYNTSLNIAAPSTPIGLNSKVIDNNVLLLWGQPATHSFPVATFMLKKSLDPLATYLTAETIGTKSGGFTNVFEESSGLYTYTLAAIDTAGNIGTLAHVTAQVNQPPDFVLTADLFRDNFSTTLYGSNTITSTRTNIVMSDRLGTGVGTNSLIGPVSPTQTFESHFTDNTWASPNAQVTAGFPVYIQPSISTGTLVDVIDYNTIITSNQYVSVSLDITNMVGTTGTYQLSVATSSDNITYTTSSSAVQSAVVSNTTFGVFATGFRYVKVTITLTSHTTGIDLIRINDYRVKLSIKYTNDGGSGTVSNTGIYSIGLTSGGTGYISVPSVSITGTGSSATAYAIISGGVITDIIVTNSGTGYTGTPTITIAGGGGTGYTIGTIVKTSAALGSLVSFSYDYIDVNSIQATYGGTTSGLAIYDFVDIPYPKYFRVLLFDTAGTAILGNFSWSAKGTI